MSDTVLTALIAASAALLGTFLSPFTDFLNDKRAVRKHLLTERHTCYSDFIQRYICLNSAMSAFQTSPDQPHNEKLREAVTEFQMAYCRAILICEDVNIYKLSDYFDEVNILISTQKASPKLLPAYRAAVEAMREEVLPRKTIFKKIHEWFSQKFHTADTKSKN